jgi:uncharacterized protein (UPF0333 family)
MKSFTKMAPMIGLVFLLAFAGIVSKTFIQKTSNTPNTLSIDEALHIAANAANKTAPIQVDKYTRLLSVEVSNGRLRYKYSLSGVSADDFEKGSINKEIGKNMQNNVCSSDGMKSLVKLGVTLEYAYYDKAGVELEVVSVETAKCTG